MKDRQKKMLRLLLTSESILRIDDLASAFSIGKRTVSRDLDEMEHWLSLKGLLLERKPNQGIRVLSFGRDPADILKSLTSPEAYIENLPPSVRQNLIFLYLIFNNREIKISELANAFFISDTSVWNDLNQIESRAVELGFSLERQKGVGIRLTGEEFALRMRFLTILSNMFSSKTVIPYLYSHKRGEYGSLEMNQFRLLLEKTRFPENSGSVLSLIEQAQTRLGYRFTMSGETLLYFYLQLSSHRIKSGAMIGSPVPESCPERFADAADRLLSGLVVRFYSGALPRREIEHLGLLLHVQEIGNLGALMIGEYGDLILPEVPELSGAVIEAFGRIDGDLYYLDEQMTGLLNLKLSSLITRLRLSIPHWRGDWGRARSTDWHLMEKTAVLQRLFKERAGLEVCEQELENLQLSFQSMVLENRNRLKLKIRCLVCCFEGIGLASYLRTILNRELPELDIVESTAVYKINQDYLDEKEVDLVLSTYPLENIETAVIPISLPLNKEELKAGIAETLPSLRKRDQSRLKSSEAVQLPFDSMLEFIQDFRFLSLPEGRDIRETVGALSRELASSHRRAGHLEKDFMKRENAGALFFEEYGIRVLHCKSGALEKPVAGVIRFGSDETARMIFMAAPSPCPDSTRLMLSEITISFMENPGFRSAVMEGDLSSLRKELMGIYRDFL